MAVPPHCVAFPPPTRVVHCDEPSRPEYHSVRSHEYHDEDWVLEAKVAMLADLMRRSNQCVAYTGAGLSVSSGLQDYASNKSKQSLAQQEAERTRSRAQAPASGFRSLDGTAILDSQSKFLASPNTSHRSLTSLFRKGFVKRVFNQNHDGLLQKAGLPQHAVNEIHGAFFDPSNPGGFELRGDLVDDMYEWASRTDLCLALGTSLSGLNADRIAKVPAQKCIRQTPSGGPPADAALGLVIVALQETQLDDLATLRIFGLLDDVLMRLDKALSSPGDESSREDANQCSKEPKAGDLPCVFAGLPYEPTSGARLRRATEASGGLLLQLHPESRFKVTTGNFAGCCGVVCGQNEEGHFLLKVAMPIEGLQGQFIEEDLLLGRWWLQEAQEGLVAQLPLVPCQ